MAVMRHIDFEVPDFGEFAEGPREQLSYRSLVMSLSPMAYWRLGEASGPVAADEMGVAHGQYVSGVTLGQAGVLAWDDDRSAQFDGSDDAIELGVIDTTHPLQLAETDFTIGVWIKPGGGGSATYQRIIDKSNASSGVGGWYLARIAMAFSKGNLAIGVNDNQFRTSGAPTLEADRWYFVAIRVTASAYTFFVDGVQQAASFTRGAAKHAQSVQTTARIAMWSVQDIRSWDGGLDELAVWDYALTDEQIAQLYRTGVGE